MGGKFFIPIAGMLAGLILWLAYFIWYLATGKTGSPPVNTFVCLVAGGLVVFSGFS